MPTLELFDETLDINSTGNYELSVQMSSSGFAFAILDSIRNKYVMIRSTDPENNRYLTAGEIEDLILHDDFLTKKYKKVKVVMPSAKFTLVPAPLFDPAKKEEYFSFNLTRDDNDVIVSNRISDPDAYIVFSEPGTIYHLAEKFWPGVFPFHHTRPLFSQLSQGSRSVSGNYVHVHVEKDFFNIIIYTGGSLNFSNTFTYRNISDILYFVLNIFRVKGIGNDATIHFSGHTGKFDDISSGFAMYVRNIIFTEPSGNFTFSYVFNELELHRYINLFNLANCES
ncbi:MAG TPA: DUF3822 family protein [Bacteroidales bacterium]|nr:DUF3822 family protein [Bacteroidales bacterium]HPF04216.1 DUF3822 family protein [Bacteroidales bacterium]HPJ60346.1 DUF3822 family protein [Bacteroidales bacterium]HPR10750.1 DUF3822 family protein [Bacteroidales bacterium]HRW85947.1 DUF3822 family protein [Bacteroidales bacterium]